MEGQRSSLILEAIRIVTEYKPSVFIWENVKGAFSSNNGADFWAIITAFANIGGYRLEWQLLNTSWFLPQNRERIYLIGHLTGRSEPGVFPITKNNRWINEGTKQTRSIRTLTAGGHSGGLHSSMTLVRHRSDKDFKHEDISPTLRNGDKGEVRIVCNTKKGFEIVTENDSINFSVPTSKTRRGRVGVAQTLDTQCTIGVKQINHSKEFGNQPHQQNRVYDTSGIMAYLSSSRTDDKAKIKVSSQQESDIRRLTEIECERLQGFPDDWTKYGSYIDKQGNELLKEIPKTQRYKMCGNAVTTDVVRAIAERLNII